MNLGHPDSLPRQCQEDPEVRAYVRDRLDALPLVQRQAIELHLDGMEWPEIGRRMGMDRWTTEKMRRLAAAKLRSIAAPS